MTPKPPIRRGKGPPAGRRWSWPGLLAWTGSSLAVAVLIGAASVTLETFFAPLIFFPLLVGVLFGGLALGLLRQCNVGSRPIVAAALVLAGAVLVTTQHYAHYRHALEQLAAVEDRLQPLRAAFPEGLPERLDPQRGFVGFLTQQAAAGRPYLYGYTARGPWAWASWALDGAILVAAALGVVLPALRQPYCARCRHWYRTTRSGRVRRRLACPLAEVIDAEIPPGVETVHFRLLNCQGGCGPTGLVLASRRREGLLVASAWLDAAGRQRVTEILDGTAPANRPSPVAAPPASDHAETADDEAPPVDSDL